MSLLVTQFGLSAQLQLPFRYNVAPTQQVAAIRQAIPADSKTSNGYGFTFLRWGLVPFWAKDPKIGSRMINARSETVQEKPSFRSAFKYRRCLILADGYFEWRKINAEKQPYYIHRPDHMPFAMAGLWETWESKESDAECNSLETCTILTTEANRLTREVHDRMPVILAPTEIELWLSESAGSEDLLKLLRPSLEDDLVFEPVSRIVNSPRRDEPECIQPIELTE
jgi:putative SOS response-associated peptidase YedK